MVIRGDDGGFIEIERGGDNDIWVRTLNDMHEPVRIRSFFGGRQDVDIYDLFNEFLHNIEKLNSRMIIK